MRSAPAANAEIGCAHVRAFFRAVEAERNTPKIRSGHALRADLPAFASYGGSAGAVAEGGKLRPYWVDDFACPLNTVSMAACAHFSPSPLDTPIAPIT